MIWQPLYIHDTINTAGGESVRPMKEVKDLTLQFNLLERKAEWYAQKLRKLS